MTEQTAGKALRGAVIGYGGAFNMGKGHLGWMQDAGVTPAAACDIDPERVAAASLDFPGIRTYTRVEDLFADPDIDLVTIITPHNTHASLAIAAAKAGKHVVVEKPMCIAVVEASAMIDAAKSAPVVLSVFHNRRYDGDFMAIKEIVTGGEIGEPFEIHGGMGGYHRPGTWWRSDKAISGGILYDWGAHFIDWILNLMPGRKVVQVTGALQKRMWLDRTNEDHGHLMMRFDDGGIAELTQSSLMAVPMPRWRILSTKGGVLDDGSVKDGFKVYRNMDGRTYSAEARNKTTAWNSYYKDLVQHLRGEAELNVTPESARRIIAVIEAAERSSKSGRSEGVEYER